MRRRDFLSMAAAGLVGSALKLRAEALNPTPVGTIRRLSWAGIRIETATTSLFVDPWISPATFDGAWTQPVVPVEATNARRSVLVTHLHNDHFDPAALKAIIGEKGQVICHARIAAGVASRGFRVRAVDPYQPESFGDFDVIAIPASDGFGESQVSWIVSTGGRRLIHCGDTLWHGAFGETGRHYGPFDFAFLPINGAVVYGDPPDSGMPISMTPEQAVAAALVLRASKAVPIHYGANSADYVEQANAESRFRNVAAQRGVTVVFMSPGQTIDWI